MFETCFCPCCGSLVDSGADRCHRCGAMLGGDGPVVAPPVQPVCGSCPEERQESYLAADLARQRQAWLTVLGVVLLGLGAAIAVALVAR